MNPKTFLHLNEPNHLNDRDDFMDLENITSTSNELKPDMNPEEIAEVVSDHLISIIKDQFEETRRKLAEKNAKTDSE